ncbi:MAG: S16 family serine protease [Candidatus Aminicenantales bacterium]
MRRHLGWIALFLVIAFVLGGLSAQRLAGQKTVYLEKQIPGPVQVVRVSDSNVTFASLSVPAVDPNGEGVIVRIDVQSRPGSGEVLTDIERILFWVDTQHSIRIARGVAENLTGLEMDEYDLVYTITANASVIEGPSAGAALTIATIAALQNKTLNPAVTITGTVEEDGSVGSAGGILEKARAAKEQGATLFLVPEGSMGIEGTERTKSCTVEDGTEYCRVEYVPKKVDITEEAEINVQEVKTIEEALEHFL